MARAAPAARRFAAMGIAAAAVPALHDAATVATVLGPLLTLAGLRIHRPTDGRTWQLSAAASGVALVGGGIPADIAGRVFDPFFTTKGVGRGTGQGSAISRAIVSDRHDGALTFETVPGQGTTFHVRLPIAAARATESREAAA